MVSWNNIYSKSIIQGFKMGHISSNLRTMITCSKVRLQKEASCPKGVILRCTESRQQTELSLNRWGGRS